MSLLLALQGSGFTLTAESGNYTLSGTAATLTYNRVLVASGGTYALSGTAATLKFNRLVVASGGTYAISGTAATFTVTRVLVAAGGSYTLTGTAATLALGRELVTASGSYSISGTAASLTFNRLLDAAGGVYSLTGSDATFQLGRTLDAGSGTYALSGADATLTYTPIPPAPATSEELKGGRRIEWDELSGKKDEPRTYVPLDDRTIAELWPSKPASVVTAAPVAAPALFASTPPKAVALPWEQDEPDMALMAAIIAALDEDF